MEAVFAALAGFIFLGETMQAGTAGGVRDDPGGGGDHAIECDQIKTACHAGRRIKIETDNHELPMT